jgi:hypothetical protein
MLMTFSCSPCKIVHGITLIIASVATARLLRACLVTAHLDTDVLRHVWQFLRSPVGLISLYVASAICAGPNQYW